MYKILVSLFIIMFLAANCFAAIDIKLASGGQLVMGDMQFQETPGAGTVDYTTDANIIVALPMSVDNGTELDLTANNHDFTVGAAGAVPTESDVPSGWTGTSRQFGYNPEPTVDVDSHLENSTLDNAISGLAALTIYAKFKVDDIDASGDAFKALFGQFSASAADRQALLAVREGATPDQFAFRFYIYDSSQTEYLEISTVDTYAQNTWYAAFGVWNGTTMTIYVDAASASSGTALSDTINSETAITAFVGGSGVAAHTLVGNIAECAMWSRALTVDEMTNITNNGMNGNSGSY